MTDADVLVVGGGPVGLFAAVALRRRGRDVVVVEPRHAPIDKACGEGLMPGALRLLAAAGVEPGGRDFDGIRYQTASGGRSVEARFHEGPGRGVRRTHLHQVLWDAARDSKAELVAGKVVAVRQLPREVHVTLADGERLSASHVVAADGLRSPTRRMLGLTTAPPRVARFGLRRHYPVAPWSDLVEVHWGRWCEAYVTPVDDGTVGVALLTSARGRTFDELLGGLPALGDRLAGVVPLGRTLGAGPLRQKVPTRVVGRTLLVGDAAGYVDALTGEGLTVGFGSAAAAAACIVAAQPERYDAAWRAGTRRSRWLTASVVELSGHPASRRLVVPAAARLPRVFDQLVAALA